MHALITAAGGVNIPDAEVPSFLDMAAIVGLGVAVAGLILMLVGLGALMKSKKGDVKGTANIGLAALIAGAIFAAGATGALITVATGSLDFLIS